MIEAKIRIRKQELQEEEDKFQQRRETSSSIRTITSNEGNCIEATVTGMRLYTSYPNIGFLC